MEKRFPCLKPEWDDTPGENHDNINKLTELLQDKDLEAIYRLAASQREELKFPDDIDFLLSMDTQQTINHNKQMIERIGFL